MKEYVLSRSSHRTHRGSACRQQRRGADQPYTNREWQASTRSTSTWPSSTAGIADQFFIIAHEAQHAYLSPRQEK